MTDTTLPTLYVRKELDLAKVVAFLRANARKVRFLVEEPWVNAALAQLEAFARENPGKLVLEVVEPDGERVALYVAGGALAGACLGGAVAGLPGAVAGGVAGACAGYAAAHLRVSLERSPDGGALLTLA